MKDIFYAYFRPSEEDLSELWAGCTFMLDANVLLNLYRYPLEARKDLMGVFKQIADRMWLPHQAALEYQENRLAVMADQVKRYDQVKSILRSTQRSLESELAKLQLSKRHSSINPDKILAKVTNAINSFSAELEQQEAEQPDVFQEDALRSEIAALFGDRIGKPPPSQKWLDDVYREGKERYSRRQPPGYRDTTKSEGERSEYVYNQLVFKREYGDLILWKEMIGYSKERNIKQLIFLTDDDKEDWWWIAESRGEKTIGPRHELVEEMRSAANVSLFYMYTSERFLEFAKRYLALDVSQESIDQVRSVAQLSRLADQDALVVARMSHTARDQLMKSKQAVYEWLLRSSPTDVTLQRGRFPGLIVESERDGERTGYDVLFIPKDGLRRYVNLNVRVKETIDKGYDEVSEGRLDKFILVLVVEVEADAEPVLSAAMQSAHLPDNPHNVDFAVGSLVTGDSEDDISFKWIDQTF